MSNFKNTKIYNTIKLNKRVHSNNKINITNNSSNKETSSTININEKSNSIIFTNSNKNIINYDVCNSKFKDKNCNNKEKLSNIDYINNKDTLKIDNNKKSIKDRIVMFSMFNFILHSIYVEDKEKAILLNKFFKYYFNDFKLSYLKIIDNLLKKIDFYKELITSIYTLKNKNIKSTNKNINLTNECISSSIGNILFNDLLVADNLINHKFLIKLMIKFNNQLQQNLYLLISDKEILQKELNTFIYNYNNLKLNKDFRNKVNNVNKKEILNKIINDVNKELDGDNKCIKEYEKDSLINVERFLIMSGQRKYYFDQKKYYINQINKLQELNTNSLSKIKENEDKYKKLYKEYFDYRQKADKEISEYIKSLKINKENASTQTLIDSFEFYNIEKNIEGIKLLNELKLNNHYLKDNILKIKYKLTKQKPFNNIDSLLFLIANILQKKSSQDEKLSDIYVTNNKIKDVKKVVLNTTLKYIKKNKSLDHFIFEYFFEQYKISKIINNKIEEMILSIVKYSEKDSRITLFKRFLFLTNSTNKYIRREVLDLYLIFLKALPFSIHDIYSNKFNNLKLSVIDAVSIFESYFKVFEFNDLVKVYLLNSSICFLEITDNSVNELSTIKLIKSNLINCNSNKENLLYLENFLKICNNFIDSIYSNININLINKSDNNINLCVKQYKEQKEEIFNYIIFNSKLYLNVNLVLEKFIKVNNNFIKKFENNDICFTELTFVFFDIFKDYIIYYNKEANMYEPFINYNTNLNSEDNKSLYLDVLYLYTLKLIKINITIKLENAISCMIDKLCHIHNNIVKILTNFYKSRDFKNNEEMNIEIYLSFFKEIHIFKSQTEISANYTLIKYNRPDLLYVSLDEFIFYNLNTKSVYNKLIKLYK